jgi:hypothetical protein
MPRATATENANFMNNSNGELPRRSDMKIRIAKMLKFWVDVECEHRKNRNADKRRQALVAKILREWEEAGEAMRFVDRKGRIAWKATPSMLTRLADAERDAKDELGDWP